MNKKSMPLLSLSKVINRKNIDTNPDYQRPAVWKKSQKQLLIDSILRDYDIPKIYFHKKNDGKYDVVDGQQRIRTIWDFYDDKFELEKESDDVNGFEIGGKKYSELPEEVAEIIDSYNLDVVILEDETDEEIREIFLRFQNGTSLKAQEKRNAMFCKMRDFVKKISSHNFFESLPFEDKRYIYDLIAAQMCLIAINKGICNIKNNDLNEMYNKYKNFDENSKEAKEVIKVLNYLYKMFPKKAPELKRYSVISLFVLIFDLINNYSIIDRHKEIADWFIGFEKRRNLEEDKSPDNQDPKIIAYHEKVSNSSDTFDSLKFRHETLKEDLLFNIKNLPLKDKNRNFDDAQRQVIFRRDKGICQKCGKECGWNDWEADHIIPWSKGGITEIENGQLLCAECNSKKSNKE